MKGTSLVALLAFISSTAFAGTVVQDKYVEKQKDVVVEQEKAVQQDDFAQVGQDYDYVQTEQDYLQEGYYQEEPRTACAPEVVAGNLQATDKTLKALATSEDFRGADGFKSAVNKITSFSSNRAKMAAYLDMVGIDANDNRAIAEFVGARQPKAEWLSNLERKAGLNAYQADRVVDELTSALKGGLH